MKLILTILTSFIFLLASSQTIRQNIGGSSKVRSFVQGTMEGDSGLVLRYAADTSLLNGGNFTKNVNSILVRVGKKLVFRDLATSSWIPVGVDSTTIINLLNDSIKYITSVYPVIITALNDSTYEWKLWQSFIDSALANNSGVAPVITWSVLDSLSTPPGSPQIGNIYLVGTSPTGVFSGQPNKIATYATTLSYTFQSSTNGDLLYNATNSFVSQWNGTNWVRVTINNFVHITGIETIIGKKTFLDTLILSGAKGIKLYSTPNANVNFLETVSQGASYPWLSIKGNSAGSKLVMGANNPGSAADELRLIADYTDTLWTGTYRPLIVDAYDYLKLRGRRSGGNDTAISFVTTGNLFNYVGHFLNSGKFTLNKYGSASSFLSSDTTANKPLGADASGNLVRMNNWAGSGGAATTGTPNTVRYFNADGRDSSDVGLVYSGGNVGIGTTPTVALDVAGDVKINNNGDAKIITFGGMLTRYDFGTDKFHFGVDAITVVNGFGFVGINNTGPTAALDVTGSVKLNSITNTPSPANKMMVIDTVSKGVGYVDITGGGSNVGDSLVFLYANKRDKSDTTGNTGMANNWKIPTNNNQLTNGAGYLTNAVTSFGKVDGYGITSSVSNATTTPVHTIAWDSTTAAKLRDAALNTLTNTGATNAANIALKKNLNDSSGNAGFTTLFQYNKGKDSLQANINTKGTGTVSSIATGYGITGGTITTTGTLVADTTVTAKLRDAKLNSLTDTATAIRSQVNTNTTNIATNTTNIATNTSNINLRKLITDSTAATGYASRWQVSRDSGRIAVNTTSIATKLDSIRLVNTGILHTTPATFAVSGTTGVVTQTLATQSAYKVFARASGSGTPSFNSLDSNYWAGAWATQVRAAQNNSSGWGLTGNAGGTAGDTLTYLGTNNLTNLRFKTNGIQRMMIDSAGNIGIGGKPLTQFYLLYPGAATVRIGAVANNVISTLDFTEAELALPGQYGAYCQYDGASDIGGLGIITLGSRSNYLTWGANKVNVLQTIYANNSGGASRNALLTFAGTPATTTGIGNSSANQAELSLFTGFSQNMLFGTNVDATTISTSNATMWLSGNKNVIIGGTSDVPSALVSMESTTKGLLIPRMTTTQMNAIASPATGLMIFNTTDNVNYTYNGSAWVSGLTNGAQTIAGAKTITSLVTNVLTGTGSGSNATLGLYQGTPLLTSYGYFMGAYGTVGNVTSGTKRVFYDNSTFQPTSGTATLASFEDNRTINQTGGANGATWGFKANATLTAAAYYIAFEAVVGKIVYSATNTTAGTTGAQTINKISGKVNAVAASTSLVVTNSLVTASSIVMCELGTNDATARILNVVEAAGSFTINYVAPTAETVIKFWVIN